MYRFSYYKKTNIENAEVDFSAGDPCCMIK